jgi:hypothetical protein
MRSKIPRPMPPGVSALPQPRPEPPDPKSLVRRRLSEHPPVMCPMGRGWLLGWMEIGAYCGFGGEKGTAAARIGRKWEKLYGLPVRRLPDRRPRAIPYELDQWLITFSEMLQGEAA